MDNKTDALLNYTALKVINESLFNDGVINLSTKENIEKALNRDYFLLVANNTH